MRLRLKHSLPLLALAVVTATLIGRGRFARPGDDAYAGVAEAAVRDVLGAPAHEFVGHYGNPPAAFVSRFPGEVKTLVFSYRGGDYYVSFERRPGGWVGICSSWLPAGGVF